MPDRDRAAAAVTRTRRALAWLLCAALALAGCTGAPDSDGVAERPSGRVVVFAAASLTDAFDEIAAAFVATNPEVEVAFNYAGSQTLARQINEGAPADVFASANLRQMEAVAAEGNLAGEAEVFASNLLEIAVEPGNPLDVSGLADLADPDLVLVLPTDEVPAGQYAREALDAAGVAVTPASLEQDVRAARSKVELGEADAAIVFASDIVASDGRVTGVAIPAEHNIPATYPIAVLADAPNPTAAAAFLAFVLGDEGQAVLAAHGFIAS